MGYLGDPEHTGQEDNLECLPIRGGQLQFFRLVVPRLQLGQVSLARGLTCAVQDCLVVSDMQINGD